MSNGFKLFTPEQKYKANQIPIKDLLDALGEKVIKSGKEYRWLSHNSVTLKNNVWYQHSTNKGGMTVNFLMCFFNYSYKEAIEFILNEFEGYTPKEYIPLPAEPLIVPLRHFNCNKVFSYLRNYRFIDEEVIRTLISSGLIYEDSKYHNCVFLGLNENNEIKHIHRRSTMDALKPFRGNQEGSDANYSFHIDGTDNSLYVFEAPIDMLSFITLNKDDWKDHNFVALCGVSPSALIKQLDLNPNINRLFLCLDYDIAGDEATDRIIELLQDRNLSIEVIKPRFKDFNEDIRFKKNLPVLAGVDNPVKVSRNKLSSKMLIQLNQSKEVTVRDLTKALSPFIYSYDSDSPSDRRKSLELLISGCVNALFLAKQQYKHLGIDANVIDEMNKSYPYSDKPKSSESIKTMLTKQIHQMKTLIDIPAYQSESEKLSMIKNYMNLANFCLNAHVFLLQQEQSQVNTSQTLTEISM